MELCSNRGRPRRRSDEIRYCFPSSESNLQAVGLTEHTTPKTLCQNFGTFVTIRQYKKHIWAKRAFILI